MKQRFLAVFFIIFFFSCKKDETSDQLNSTAYYFEATLSDGRTFKLKEDNPASPNPGTHFRAELTSIVLTGTAMDKNACVFTPDCFIWTFGLDAEKEGTYTPLIMGLVAKEGTEQYTYQSHIDTGSSPARGNVNMTISKIERGTAAGAGILQGTFSGTVVRSQATVPNIETPFQISGKFRLPLTQ